MNILIVSADERERAETVQMLAEHVPDAELLPFDSGLTALAAARRQEIDIAVIDTELPELGGLDFGAYLQELYPQVNLIYITQLREAGFEALRQHASGILSRPVAGDALNRELQELRYPTVLKNRKRLFAQTFGNFELFADGKPVAFKYNRTKELVAVLVNNRGAQTSNGEIIASLWEDDGDPDKKASYLSNLRQDLQNTITKLKLNGIIIKQRGSLAIATDRIECDLYDWLEKKQESKYHYLGDYMNQYSWPEVMHAELDEIAWSFDE